MDAGHEVGERAAPIVVGIDGSASALAAARWAAREAVLRRAPLRLLHAAGRARDARPDAGKEVLAVATAHLAEVVPGARVTRELLTGAPAALLVRRSAQAQLVVIGHRGLGAVSGLVLGSVGTALAAQALCPVVAVRAVPDPPPDGPVVVGVDDSPSGEAALAFAVRTALARGTLLRAVRACPHGPDELLPRLLDRWHDTLPELRVEPVVVPERPAPALIHHVDGARLLVVGARRRVRPARATLGSVGQTVLRHVVCPVAIVPEAPVHEGEPVEDRALRRSPGRAAWALSTSPAPRSTA